MVKSSKVAILIKNIASPPVLKSKHWRAPDRSALRQSQRESLRTNRLFKFSAHYVQGNIAFKSQRLKTPGFLLFIIRFFVGLVNRQIFLSKIKKSLKHLYIFCAVSSIIERRKYRVIVIGGVYLSTIIAVTNQKGGVGKTTTSSSLLAALHQRGFRVLGIDLDPQGSLGFCLGLDIENCATVYDVMKGAKAIGEVIVETECGDILPSNILLSGAELEFNRPGREFLLKNQLKDVQDDYDFVIIDTPPALNILTVNAYVAADSLIIPMAPEILSLLGISQIRETIETVRRCYNPNLKVLGILLNKFNPRLNLNREVLDLSEQIASQLDSRVFNAKIRASVAVAEAPAHGESVLTYAPSSKPALDFQALLNELLNQRLISVRPAVREAD